jgi:hypothetical protein
MADQPVTLQLRYLQTLTEIASERNSTVIFPIPIDLINMFMNGRWRRPTAPRREIRLSELRLLRGAQGDLARLDHELRAVGAT